MQIIECCQSYKSLTAIYNHGPFWRSQVCHLLTFVGYDRGCYLGYARISIEVV